MTANPPQAEEPQIDPEIAAGLSREAQSICCYLKRIEFIRLRAEQQAKRHGTPPIPTGDAVERWARTQLTREQCFCKPVCKQH